MIRQIIGLGIMGIGAGIFMAAVMFYFSNRKEQSELRPLYQDKGLKPVRRWEKRGPGGRFIK